LNPRVWSHLYLMALRIGIAQYRHNIALRLHIRKHIFARNHNRHTYIMYTNTVNTRIDAHRYTILAITRSALTIPSSIYHWRFIKHNNNIYKISLLKVERESFVSRYLNLFSVKHVAATCIVILYTYNYYAMF
jgi:hypothetical protein